MDWLDKLSIVAIAGLTLITAGMLANQEITKRRLDNPGRADEGEKSSYSSQTEMDKQIFAEVTAYRKKGLYAEAIAEVEDIVKSHPEKSLSYVYLAQLHVEQGKLADSIHSYRRAVEMEPDYVDPRTPLFMGDEIKKLVKEGMEKLEREKTLKPKDEGVRQALKDVYYLQRRLAGGCE
jgi:tetratricopeptide (TPR) repeat protein